MNAKIPALAAIGVLVALATSTSFRAQTVPAAPNDSGDSESRTVLSPFLVNDDKDPGYGASSTLAGTRLNTPVRDLAASISIYTKNFLDDVGATNATDLLVFATGMESAGMGGGNISGDTNDINSIRTFGDSNRQDPQGSSRTRGLTTPTFTRNYVATGIPFDSYNTSTVTVNRGPNAALFGVGSAAGIVDTALISADIHRNTNQVSVRYGNNGAWRESLDVNRVIIPHKLAGRLALLNDDEEFNQRPAFQHQKRIYSTVTYEPFKSTSFGGSFESGRINANRPISSLPFNGIADFWYAAGRPSYDWTQYDDPAKSSAAAATIAGANTEGFLFGTRLTPFMTVVYSEPNAAAPSMGFFGTTPTTTTNTANAIQSTLFNPIVNRDSAADTIRFLMTPQLLDVAAGYWTPANTPKGQLPGFVPAGMKSQTFTDYGPFDWRNREIDTTGRQNTSFHTYNLRFEQRGWRDRLGLELAYDRQRRDNHGRDSLFANGNNNLVYVDVNVFLPTGQRNPNLGRPLAVGQFHRMQDSSEDRQNERATAYMKYDFKDAKSPWLKWLGRHTLSGLREISRVDSLSVTFREAMQGDAANTVAGNINVSNRFYSPIVYLGPSIIGNNNPLKLEPITVDMFKEGPSVPFTYFARAANNTDPGQFVTAPSSVVDVLQNGAFSREIIKSKAAVLQSNWLNDLFVTTLSWRRDADYYYSGTLAYTENPKDRNDPGQVHYGFNDLKMPNLPDPFAAKEITGYGAVLRWPQRLLRLPARSDFSVFFNSSANFTPTGGRINVYGDPLPSPSGRTKEWGFNLTVIENRVSIRFNRFETAIKSATLTPNFIGAATVNAVNQTWMTWQQEGNINPAMAQQQRDNAALLLSVLPANWKDLYALTVSGTAPNVVASIRNGNLAGTSDTTDYTAVGSEADIVVNPTRNWRMLINVAKQETVQSNSYPVLKEWFARMQPVWDKLANVPKGNYPLGFKPGDTLPASVQTFKTFLDTNVWVPWATALATEGSASAEQRKWRVNLVTNYTFRSDSPFGAYLKGFGVGTGVRWQDRLGLGYPSTRNADGSVNVDIKHPYWAPSQMNVNAWLSYQRALKHGITWKVQLNVNNVIGDTDLIGVNVQSWNGQISTYRVPPDRRWYLNNTFSF